MAIKPPKGKSLAELNPELAKQWHPNKNDELTAFDVTSNSYKKVWWKCEKGDDHEWITSVGKRSNGTGCPICYGNKVVLSNCLATLNPELAKQWHPTKNGELTPYDVTLGSNKKVWWQCEKGNDHEWMAVISSRSSGIGCSVCSGKTIVLSNCLATTHSVISKTWHPTKNGELTPFDVISGSHKKVWWKCEKGDDHEWESSISNRKKHGCPICTNQKVVQSNCLATTHPELAKEWHPTKNGKLTPYDMTLGSNKKVWWKCEKGDDHEWYISPNGRLGCPVCSNHKIVESNCLATTNPDLAKEWHPNKNKKLTPENIGRGSGKKIWWKCEKGDDHEWQSSVESRSKLNLSCPVCSNQKVVQSNCLSTTHPDLAKEWHPNKNKKLTPDDVVDGSEKRIWWKCEKGDDHEWQSSVRHRTKSKSSCPVCVNQKVVKSNCLSTTHPKLAKEWHTTKNRELTPDEVVWGSHKKVWWKCSKGNDHQWEASIVHRSSNESGCPFCTLTPQSKQELTITFELIQFFEDIDPRGFKTKINGKIRSVDIYIPELKLAIEFDGSYWHKGKRALDKLKTIQLKQEGLNVIRIREQSKVAKLKKITKNDVISKTPFNPKEVANKVLKQIMKMYNLDAKKVRKIENYLDKKELQNEKGLDKYIDMILTEKAEKK